MRTEPELAVIAAVAENRVIGIGNRLPWRLKDDLRHFKSITWGKPVIMGRRTWESIGGRPLPGRTNLVVTRQPGYRAAGAVVCPDLPEATAQARVLAQADAVDEMLVIGGASLYGEALPLAQRFYLTLVHDRPMGDTYFPAWDMADWREVSRQEVAADGDAAAHVFFTLERRR